MFEILVIAGVAIALNFLVNLFANNILFPGEQTEMLPPSEIIDESSMTETDRKMAEQSREIIADHLGEQPVDALLSLNAEDRITAMGNILEEMARLYNVPIKGAEFTQMADGICGVYCHSERVIRVNVKYLMCNDRAVLLDVLDTIVHELRHAVQWSMIDGNATWNASDERRQAFARNFRNYVRPNRDIRGYQLQPVERDATTFAAMVLRGVNG